MPAEPYQYRAFISYSHQDATWASWLHRALERYRVPSRLVGRETAMGAIPKRLFPVFRDRDELSSSSELGTVINEALRRSACQIVVCSPRAAGSRWVNEEIRTFKSLARESRVLALIVDGEPHAADPLRECFPAMLTQRVDASGRPTGDAVEPLAADARSGGDGREAALLKLIAGMLGIGYDELRQRERQQRFWQRLRAAAASLVLGAAVFGLVQETQARQARAERAARLDRLYDLGREEALKGNAARAATYLGAAYAGGYDSAGLRYLLGRTMPAVEALEPGALQLKTNPEVGLAAFSHDGRQVYTVAQDTIAIWNLAERRLVARTEPFLSANHDAITINPDDASFVYETNDTAFSTDVSLTIFDSRSARPLATLKAQTSAGQARGSAFRSYRPDGRELLVIDAQRRASIVDARSGARRRTLPGAGLVSASYSADGRRIVTGSRDGRIAVLDAASGRVQREFDARPAIATRAFFSADGRQVFALNGDGSLKLYSAADGRLVDAYGGHAAGIEIASMSRDGQRLMTAARDGVKLWDLAAGKQLMAVPFESSLRAGLDLRPDGRQFVAMLDKTRAAIWDVDSNTQTAILEGHTSTVDVVAYAPDGRHLLSGSNDGSARFWDTSRLEPQPRAWLAHGAAKDEHDVDGTIDATFAPDGRLLATTGSDAAVRLWDGVDGSPVRVLEGHARMTRQVNWRPDGKQLASASADGTTRLWDAASGRALAVLRGHTAGRVHSAIWNPDGSRLLTVAGNYEDAEADTMPRLLDSADGALAGLLRGHRRWVFPGASFSADGRYIATASEDRTARLWDGHDGRLLHSLEGHGDEVLQASFSGDGRRVATASTDGSARVWDTASGRELFRLERPELGGFGYARYGSDGTRVGLCSVNGVCLLWQPESGAVTRLVGHTSVSYWMQFSPDGALLATAGNDGTAKLWETASGRLLHEFRVPTRYGYMQKATFSPDGLRLATSGQSTPATAELWSLAPDTRSAAEIAERLRCRSPWVVDGERLVPVSEAAARCAADAQQ